MFHTKKEKYAYVKGIKAGNKGAKPWGKNYKRKNYKHKNYKKKTPRAGAYNSRGRINDGRVDDRHGPVVFWEGFLFDHRGRMKGSYTPDGFFEPD